MTMLAAWATSTKAPPRTDCRGGLHELVGHWTRCSKYVTGLSLRIAGVDGFSPGMSDVIVASTTDIMPVLEIPTS